MTLLFKNNMGDIHIWRLDEKYDPHKFSRNGLHNSLSTYDGRQSDEYIQFNTEEVDRMLTQEKLEELNDGYPVTLG